MHTSIVRLIMAALMAIFVVAACAGQSGAQWTYAPVAVASQASSGNPGRRSANQSMLGGLLFRRRSRAALATRRQRQRRPRQLMPRV